MSLKYRDGQGNETPVAGLNGTSGELIPSVSLYKTGSVTFSCAANSWNTVEVTFNTPMPDADYQVILDSSANAYVHVQNVTRKFTTGFIAIVWNRDELNKTGVIEWQAFKLMTDEATALDEAQIAQNTKNFAPAFIESTAYSVGQYVTYAGKVYRCTAAHSAGAWDPSHFTAVTVGGTLGEIVPSNASSSNKLVTASDTVKRVNYSITGTTDAVEDTKTLVNYIITLGEGSYVGEFKRTGVTFGSYRLTYFTDGDGTISISGTVTYSISDNNDATYQISYVLSNGSSTPHWNIEKLVTDRVITGVPTSVHSGISNVVLKKQGKMVTLTVSYDATSMSTSDWTTIMNVPVGFRPAYGVSIPVGNAWSMSSVANLYPSGELSIYKNDAAQGPYNYINATWTTE